ncbi:hypothetical protein AUEXF2481DRAFT_371048 [Aureobasidium subglaciale EXF-2481]|uniref:Secreted protein n=1 Tax=Aureobasidium subglaciale (strain EXF-2481) TaxID=1043005 RepID=A0A074YRC9_AURSE|nr:uncharacterized protein AUEXF2481DRAFT_371048 [Aureobasidium subglaciale EXF-2481]KEQ98714.1 hypothetical protein AUEXF2481DRAFT_371048 [Aureobasidium subglaciale EXF-2481]
MATGCSKTTLFLFSGLVLNSILGMDKCDCMQCFAYSCTNICRYWIGRKTSIFMHISLVGSRLPEHTSSVQRYVYLGCCAVKVLFAFRCCLKRGHLTRVVSEGFVRPLDQELFVWSQGLNLGLWIVLLPFDQSPLVWHVLPFLSPRVPPSIPIPCSPTKTGDHRGAFFFVFVRGFGDGSEPEPSHWKRRVDGHV